MPTRPPDGYRELPIGEVLEYGDLVRIGDATFLKVCPRYCQCGEGVGTTVTELARYYGRRP